ncbi:transporter substrate-binding domain-containing protein [uncultured Pseudodesulfovibrio sp.]|uniref:substrate-binding periplasmic protein n=1 Tax=uncultured Pseudodesulfovibrio sp. TaxID=2035858 RepID=UPI0029C6B147|nr:transporter substrate-binding domain-containing protein [uncultured Pseudodesulfovibrio sp.]
MAEDYPPYSFPENGQAAGFVSEVVRLILDEAGQGETAIHFYPWARAYMKLQNGSGDVLYPMARTPGREALFRFVGPVFSDAVYFYKKRNASLTLTSIEDAKKVTSIGVTRNDLYHQLLKEKGFINLDVSSKQEHDFRKLFEGRVTLVPMGEKSIRNFMDRVQGLDLDMFEKTGPMWYRSEAYVAFSKQVPVNVVQKWQEILDRLKGTGKYEAIMNRYFPVADN